jgi:hypothetical protein
MKFEVERPDVFPLRDARPQPRQAWTMRALFNLYGSLLLDLPSRQRDRYEYVPEPHGA